MDPTPSLRFAAAPLAALLALCACVCAEPVTTEATRQRAVAAASAELQRHAALWSSGDIEGFTAAYADDCVFLSPSGITRGRQEVLDRYRKRYPDRAAMGALTLEVLDARAAVDAEGRGAVSVGARWTLTYPDKDSLTGLTLVVLRTDGERWTIVQDASM